MSGLGYRGSGKKRGRAAAGMIATKQVRIVTTKMSNLSTCSKFRIVIEVDGVEDKESRRENVSALDVMNVRNGLCDTWSDRADVERVSAPAIPWGAYDQTGKGPQR